MARVWLDAGHGGSDPGAVAGAHVEKRYNLDVTMACKKELEANSVVVGLTRDIDKYVSISDRARLANNWRADLFISIHFNAGGGDGIEAIHGVGGETTSKVLAWDVVKSVSAMTGQNLRGIPVFYKVGTDGTDFFGVIRNTRMPAIITECAFVDSADIEVDDTLEERQNTGIAMARGIMKYLGITPITSDVVSEFPKHGIVNADILNIRSGIGTDNPIIAQVTKGTDLVVEALQTDWYTVVLPVPTADYNRGYVAAEYVTIL